MLNAKVVMAVILSPGMLLAQSALTLSSSSASGGSASLALSLVSAGGAQPAALQWTLNYAPADVLSISAVAGAAAVAAGKSITCASSASSYTCILAGNNANVIADGVVANIAVTLTPGV